MSLHKIIINFRNTKYFTPINLLQADIPKYHFGLVSTKHFVLIPH